MKNPRAAGYYYRKKGKIPLDVIDKMTERLNAYTIDDDLAQKRRDVIRALLKRSDFTQARARDVVTREMKHLAERIPKDASFYYSSKDMIPFRNEVDRIVEMLFLTNTEAFNADMAFQEELDKKERALQAIMGSYYQKRLEKDSEYKETSVADLTGVRGIKTIDRLRWDYRRRLGNFVLRDVQRIQKEKYKRSPRRRYKTNDKTLKRNLAISRRKVGGILEGLFAAVTSIYLPETKNYHNRLREIEEEMQAEHEEEERKKKRPGSGSDSGSGAGSGWSK